MTLQCPLTTLAAARKRTVHSSFPKMVNLPDLFLLKIDLSYPWHQNLQLPITLMTLSNIQSSPF
jgi:hypothetical protein